MKKSEFRPGAHPLGLHRVIEPKGVLPQAALRLDTSLPIFEGETLIEVERLHIDSASFRQLRQAHDSNPEKIIEQILAIVRERGKMENPVTRSGGILIGRILESARGAPELARVGDKIATLVSLTLTPLQLDAISLLDLGTGQVQGHGYAILFASGVAAPLPADLPEETAIGVFDVCGAPAWARRLVTPSDRVLILGAGKSGILSAAAVREKVARDALVMADLSAAALEGPTARDLAGTLVRGDAQDPVAFQRCLKEQNAGEFDLVINTSNAPETESACILAARDGGKILFFNMATQFQRAVLSAEGVGKDVGLIMGNGFAKGHWEYALDLVRRYPAVREFFGGGGRV